MRPSLLILLLALCFDSICQERFVELEGSKISVNTIGVDNRDAGLPVIVLESGHGTPMGNWDKVIEGIAEHAPVITYDRPGIGESEAVNQPPTIKNVSDRLVKLLNHLGIAPPYILVGHSLGGLYVRGFANHYPSLLAGLIIIDPADFTETHENQKAYYESIGWESSESG